MLIKFACAQPEITAGRPDLNTQKIINLIKEAALNKADILLLRTGLFNRRFMGAEIFSGGLRSLWRRNYKRHRQL